MDGNQNVALLKFGRGNAYLAKDIATFSLPSGWTCPGALECLAKADRATGKVTDGPHMQYRCYQVNMESIYPTLRRMVWHNFDLLCNAKTRELMADLIWRSLPDWAQTIRIHVGGDFFNEAYFLAWTDAARSCPERIFYAFTKSIPYWSRLEGHIPVNMILTASEGGRYDEEIKLYYKRAIVVFSESAAAALALPIDTDDSHAYSVSNQSFALLLHGTQPKGSKAASALRALKHDTSRTR